MSDENWLQRREDSLKQALDIEAAEALYNLMSEISEDVYCAGWIIGNEDWLWKYVIGLPNRFSGPTKEQVIELRRLSEKCGGWWYWPDDDGEVFIPLEEWKIK